MCQLFRVNITFNMAGTKSNHTARGAVTTLTYTIEAAVRHVVFRSTLGHFSLVSAKAVL
jgi:hypothetical protein